MTQAAPRPSRYQLVSDKAATMLALGESGRFEFKREAEAVTRGVLAALANWVALDDEREVAQVLVGVEEITDEETGLVSGAPCGLPKGLDKAVARIQDVASKTRPIPVDLHIVEEGVANDDAIRPPRSAADHGAALRRPGPAPDTPRALHAGAGRRRAAADLLAA